MFLRVFSGMLQLKVVVGCTARSTGLLLRGAQLEAMAEVMVLRTLFRQILVAIAALRPSPQPARC